MHLQVLLISIKLTDARLRHDYCTDDCDYRGVTAEMLTRSNAAVGPMSARLKVCACCSQNEVRLLLELLPKYHAHVERYPHTLRIKFYGLHRVVPLNGSKVQSHHQSLPKAAYMSQSCLLHMPACSCPLRYPGAHGEQSTAAAEVMLIMLVCGVMEPTVVHMPQDRHH